jgi:DNA-binding response OmpR family regulator
MKILVATSDPNARYRLETALTDWGYEVALAGDGIEAWKSLQSEAAPPLVILDWTLPGIDGVQVCAKARQQPQPAPSYIILMTGADDKDDIVTGLEAGADDYITKPFNSAELRARIHVGVRTVEVQKSLARCAQERQDALLLVSELQALLPICSHCKEIRQDQLYWHQVEHFVTHHWPVRSSASLCPDCYEKFVKPELHQLSRWLERAPLDGPSLEDGDLSTPLSPLAWPDLAARDVSLNRAWPRGL